LLGRTTIRRQIGIAFASPLAGDDAMHATDALTLHDRALGAFLGFAIGDALWGWG
jgi:hypothetical protein